MKTTAIILSILLSVALFFLIRQLQGIDQEVDKSFNVSKLSGSSDVSDNQNQEKSVSVKRTEIIIKETKTENENSVSIQSSVELKNPKNSLEEQIADLKVQVSLLNSSLKKEINKNKELEERYNASIEWLGKSMLEVKDSVFREMRQLRGLATIP